ncbi:hypothetical protein AN958_01070 [Leucoagaricus sp. SymC.cos]|nr:hypothetical protein AN958_01070 [Leucoagaricus sp. SymC.cos]
MHPIHAPGYSDFFASGIRLLHKKAAMESHVKTSKATPLSFDGVLSDSESENETPKRRTRRTSLFNPLSRSSSLSPSRTPKHKKHQRSASTSFISNIFGGGRKTGKAGATNRVMSNDESGWLSSASSDSASSDSALEDNDIDFMDFSTWPECPNGGFEQRNTHATVAITDLHSEPEILDPFSSSPSSKSFFVDVNLRDYTTTPLYSLPTDTRADRVGAIPFRRPRNRTSSTGSSWSNRFSLSSLSSTNTSSSSSFFSSSRRSSLSLCPSSFLNIGGSKSSNAPPADASFLRLPVARPRMRTGVRSLAMETKRPASIHVMCTSESRVPNPPVTITTASATTPTATAAPIIERRHTHTVSTPQSSTLLLSSSVSPPASASSSIQPPLSRIQSQLSHTRSRSPPLSHLSARSRVRSLFLLSSPSFSSSSQSKTTIPSFTPAIPEIDADVIPGDDTTATAVFRTSAVGVVPPKLDSVSVPDPAFGFHLIPNSTQGNDDTDHGVDHEKKEDEDGDGDVIPPMVKGLELLIVDDEAPSSTSDARVFFGTAAMEDDVPKRVDWRQFCIEVLDGHPDA